MTCASAEQKAAETVLGLPTLNSNSFLNPQAYTPLSQKALNREAYINRDARKEFRG